MTYHVYLEDCIPALFTHLEPESIDLTVTSIPFASLFQYSGKTEDVGNSPDAGLDFVGSQFGLHLRFWGEQMLRVHKPGTLLCIHIQQLLTYKIQHGYEGRRDFRGAVVDLITSAGFDWHAEVVVPKNPQAIAQRQKLHSLLFITGKKNARGWAPAVNDHLLVFRKPGEGAPVPALYDRDENPGGWISSEEWIKWAKGTWPDIQETDVLDGYKSAREDDEERHVCPLQLELIRRCVKMWSNPGDVVLDPFSGIGSTGYVAIEQGRRYIGCELKESYYQQSLRNLEKARLARDVERGDLFSWAGVDVGAPAETENHPSTVNVANAVMATIRHCPNCDRTLYERTRNVHKFGQPGHVESRFECDDCSYHSEWETPAAPVGVAAAQEDENAAG